MGVFHKLFQTAGEKQAYRQRSRPPRGLCSVIALAIMLALFSTSALSATAIAASQIHPGELDQTFGQGGKIKAGKGEARAVLVQSDGKIVSAGSSGTPGRDAPGDFGLFRHNPDGSPDMSFGIEGRVVTPFGDTNSFVASLAIQKEDQKLVAGGMSCNRFSPGADQLEAGDCDFSLARYNPDGQLDLDFGIGGKVLTDVGYQEGIGNILIQPNGQIVASGRFTPPLPSPGQEEVVGDFAIARYNRDGTLDKAFGNKGIARAALRFGQNTALAKQADGRLLVAGGGAGFMLARFNRNGSLDDGGAKDQTPKDSFGAGGILKSEFGDQVGGEPRALAIGPDQGMFVAGRQYPINTNKTSKFAITRHNRDGALERGFGEGGEATTEFGAYSSAAALAVKSDSRLIAVGSSCSTSLMQDCDMALAMYGPHGQMENIFGKQGKVTTDFGANDLANAVVVQNDAAIVVAGESSGEVVLARYTGLSKPTQTPPEAEKAGSGSSSKPPSNSANLSPYLMVALALLVMGLAAGWILKSRKRSSSGDVG